MYDAADIDAAVQGGALSQTDADRLRQFTAARRATPPADEEELPVVGGFADVMTTVATLFVTAACAMVVVRAGPLALPFAVALVWGLAEYLLRKRRMPLTGTLLFLLFAVCWAMLGFGIAMMILPAPSAPRLPGAIAPLTGIVCATATVLGCLGWWWRFRLPLAYAAAVMAGLNVAMHVLRLLVPHATAGFVSVALLLAGIATFALAMLWDMSDIYRQTRRAAVAFWLHALAGFQIAGATFRMILGVAGAPQGWERLYSYAPAPPGTAAAGAALLVFAGFCLLALAVDRRSILMSSLIFVVPATMRLFGAPPLPDLARPRLDGGLSSPHAAVALLVLGMLLLVLSVRWSALRGAIIARLPLAVRAQLPRTDMAIIGPRPIA